MKKPSTIHQLGGYGYYPAIGSTFTIYARYRHSYVALFYWRVGKDGSLYVIPKTEQRTTFFKHGKYEITDNKLSFNYTDGTLIEPQNKNPLKFSFHSSGQTNMFGGDKRFVAESFRDLKEQQAVFSMCFRHPNYLKQVSAAEVKKEDIVLDFQVNDLYPFICEVFGIKDKSRWYF